jgi:hypothetical protein
MKTQTLLLISGIASAVYAIVALTFPNQFLSLHGITTDPNGVIFVRAIGALSVGYSFLGLFSGKVKSFDGLKLACLANFGGWTAMFFVMLLAKITLQFNAAIFADIGFCALFSVLFATKAFTKQ